MAASTILITIMGTFITEKIIEPRLGEYKGEVIVDHNELTDKERKALRWAGVSVLVFCAIIAFLILPEKCYFKSRWKLKTMDT